MNKVASAYGGIISALLQGFLYFYAFEHILEIHFEQITGLTKSILVFVLVVGAVSFVKFFETKYAIKSLADKN